MSFFHSLALPIGPCWPAHANDVHDFSSFFFSPRLHRLHVPTRSDHGDGEQERGQDCSWILGDSRYGSISVAAYFTPGVSLHFASLHRRFIPRLRAGLAQSIRFLLAYKGVDYVDKQYEVYLKEDG